MTLLGVYFYRRTVKVAKTLRDGHRPRRRAATDPARHLATTRPDADWRLSWVVRAAALHRRSSWGSFPKYLTATFDASNWTLANYASLLEPYYLQVLWNTIWLAGHWRDLQRFCWVS